MLKCLPKLAREAGLDEQDYKCLGCGNSIGLSFAAAKYSFTFYLLLRGSPFCYITGFAP